MPHIRCTLSLSACRLASALALAAVAVLGCGEETVSPTAPEPPATLATAATAAPAFFQMSAGNDHSCGVTTDNRAFCWGFYGFSTPVALGDGSTNGSLTPVAVAGGLRFRQLSAGFSATCGVTTDNLAFCWGDNARGELGDGTTTDRLTPVPVAGGLHFRQVETTFQHTCGVTLDNRPFCWGDNSQFQLGDGTKIIRLTPVAVASSLPFRQVAPGYTHTCGVTTDNRAFCWGTNQHGELGNSRKGFRRARPALVTGALQFRQVDASRDYSCAVTTDDRAFCWGDNRFGALGTGGGSATSPRAVAGGLRFTRVSAGGFLTCAETQGHRAYCWGAIFGDTSVTTHRTPVAVAGGHTFAQVSAGTFQACGKTPASVGYCWGDNVRGALGDGTTTNGLAPVPVAGPM